MLSQAGEALMKGTDIPDQASKFLKTLDVSLLADVSLTGVLLK